MKPSRLEVSRILPALTSSLTDFNRSFSEIFSASDDVTGVIIAKGTWPFISSVAVYRVRFRNSKLEIPVPRRPMTQHSEMRGWEAIT